MKNVKTILFTVAYSYDRKLIDELNIVAKQEGRTAHNMARHLLLKSLNEYLQSHDIQEPKSQLADAS